MLAFDLLRKTGIIRHERANHHARYWGKKAQVVFLNFPTFLQERLPNPVGKPKVPAEHLARAECVVWDEFGNENITSWSGTETLKLMNAYLAEEKALVMSGLHSPGALMKNALAAANRRGATEEDRSALGKAESIVERIHKYATVVELAGKSRR